MGRAESLRSILQANPPGPEGPYVYFIEALGTGLVKIGCTINLRSRLSSLRNDTALQLELRAVIPGYSNIETVLHKVFDCHGGDLLPEEILDQLPHSGWTEWVEMSAHERAVLQLCGRVPLHMQRRWVAGPCIHAGCNEHVVELNSARKRTKCWKHDTKARQWEIALSRLESLA